MRKIDFYPITRGCFTVDDVRGIVEDYASANEGGEPLPVEEQEDPDVIDSMHFLAEVEKQGIGSDATFYGPDYDWSEEAREIASGTLIKGISFSDFPFLHIDWDAAGQDLADECSSFDFDGESYLYRD